MLLHPRRLCVRVARGPFIIHRASFFLFPSPSRSLVKSHSEKRVVPFSCNEMFDVVADVARYSEFLPFCVESRVLRKPNNNVMEAALRVGFKIFTESYTSRVLMIRPNKVATKAIDSPTFKRIDSEWLFKPSATPGSCEVNFKVTFEVSSFLHSNAIKLFFDDIARTQLNAFIGRARKIYGTAPRPARKDPGDVDNVSLTKESTEQRVSTKKTNDVGLNVASAFSNKEKVSTRSKLKTSASQQIKSGMSAKNFSDLAAVFTNYADKNGKLYYGGFTAAIMALSDEYENLKDISESTALAGAVFSSFETHATPKDWLSLDEFAVGVYLMTKGTFEQKAHSLFDIINIRGDGKITRKELTQAMQQRIRAVKKLFPKLLRDQIQLRMANEQMEKLSTVQDAAMAGSVEAIKKLMDEVEKEIPLAVNQIFREADLDQDDYICEQEWMFAWQAHPEFVELLTIDGMKKMVEWASVVQETKARNDDDDEDKAGSSVQSLDTRLTYVD